MHIGISNETVKLNGSSILWCSFEPDFAIADRVFDHEVHSFSFKYDFENGQLLDFNLDGKQLDKEGLCGVQIPNSDLPAIISIWSISDKLQTVVRNCHGDSYEWSGEILKHEAIQLDREITPDFFMTLCKAVLKKMERL